MNPLDIKATPRPQTQAAPQSAAATQAGAGTQPRRPKRGRPFAVRLFLKSAIPVLCTFLITVGYVCCYLPSDYRLWAQFLLLAAVTGVFFQWIVGYFVNRRMCDSMSGAKTLEATLRRCLKLPLRKAAEVFALSVGAAIISLLLLATSPLVTPLSAWELLDAALAWVLAATIPAMCAFSVANSLCCNTAEELLAEAPIGFELTRENDYQRNEFLGISLNMLFVLYVVLPFVVAAVMTGLLVYTGTVRDGFPLVRRIIPLEALHLANITISGFIFFSRISKSTKKVQKAIAETDGTVAIPMDVSSEISYTAYLVNKIIANSNAVLTRGKVEHDELETRLASLAGRYEREEQEIARAADAVARIQSLLTEVKELSGVIGTHVGETQKVVSATAENVQLARRAVEQNTAKMEEIAQSSGATVQGIQSLSNKIHSIWEIVSLIDSIADQTKIIAFNAELEAEDINENRENFKNVAFNIRDLTNQVLDLTHHMKMQITTIQNSGTALIQQGNDTGSRIEMGTQLAGELSGNLAGITESTRRNADFSTQIQMALKQEDGTVQALLQKTAATGQNLARFNEYVQEGKMLLLSLQNEIQEPNL